MVSGSIFINYRRGESLKDAQHLATLLEKHFRGRKIFLDVHGIDGGEHWLHTLERQVAQSDAMVSLISPGWADLKDEEGNRRLDNPNDFVRFEIVQALVREIPILPVLVDGAKMPRSTQLPENLMELPRFQALPLRTESVTQDAAAIAERIKSLLAKRRGTGLPRWVAAAAAAAALLIGVTVGPFALSLAGIPMPGLSLPAAVQERIAAAESKLAKALRDGEDLGAKLEKAVRDRDQIQGSLTSVETRLADAQKQREAATGDLTKSRTEIERLNAALATAQRERAQSKTELDAANARVAELQKQVGTSRPPVTDATLSPLLAFKDAFRDLTAEGQPCPICPEMLLAPKGTFLLGSPESEPERESIEKGWESPQLRVTIAQPFAAGKFPVTRGEFAAFVKDSGYKMSDGCAAPDGSGWKEKPELSWQSPGFTQDDRHPAVCITWNDAKAYVAWLARKTGKPYRLLSDAEREYIARAGTTTPFWWGTSLSPTQAAYYADTVYAGGGTKGAGRNATVPVDAFAANPWGFFSVHGNASEWTEDCWNRTHQGNPLNGSARTSGEDCTKHVSRGGAWLSYPRILRSASRLWAGSSFKGQGQGFRVARSL